MASIAACGVPMAVTMIMGRIWLRERIRERRVPDQNKKARALARASRKVRSERVAHAYLTPRPMRDGVK
jgi:hypothetical protein